MVELRKRKEPPPAPVTAPKKERKTKVSKESNAETSEAPMATETPAEAPKPNSSGPPKVGETISLNGFGKEVQTHDGKTVTLKSLVDESKAGVVLFTYPKASTPGCTTQACLFRDSFDPLTATGLSIYGLSRDSPKANTTFQTKHGLPYPLLCDPAATLIAAIGLKNGDKTTRGVFVVTKEGKVLAAEPGGPAPTVEVVKQVVEKMGGTDSNGEEKLSEAESRVDDEKTADGTAAVADEVADTAEKLGDRGY